MSCVRLVIALAITLGWPLPDQQGLPTEMWLEIPDFNIRVTANGWAEIPSNNVTFLRLHLAKQTSQVNYGDLHPFINTLGAGDVMLTKSTTEGVICEFDLSLHPELRLNPGRNSLEMSYLDRFRRPHYASFLLITADKAPKPSRPIIVPHPVGGRRYAVVVGISQYQHSAEGIPNLRFADRDATSFKSFLLSPEGGKFAGEDVLFLANEDATIKNLRSALFTFLTRPGPSDLVVIYFAGHGAPDPNDPRNLYLLAYDTDPRDMGGTALRMEEVREVFAQKLKSHQVVTFTDSCHSYGISGETYGASPKRRAEENNLINQYLSVYSRNSQRAVITASDISQLSYEGDKWGGGHGVFTHFLLRGLQGEADLNHDGTVTAGELFYYVREHVSEATGGQQTPVAFPGLAEALPLSGAALQTPNSASRRTPESGDAKNP